MRESASMCVFDIRSCEKHKFDIFQARAVFAEFCRDEVILVMFRLERNFIWTKYMGVRARVRVCVCV